MKNKQLTLQLIALVLIFLSGCSKDAELLSPAIPITQIVKVDVAKSGVTFTGSVENVGSEYVYSYGFVWSSQKDPTINDHVLAFSKPLSSSTFSKTEYAEIEYEKIYYVRTFVKTSNRVIYGNTMEFQGKSTLIPTIDKVSPLEFSDGDIVTITGKGFSSLAANNKVTLGGIPVTLIKSNPDSLSFKVPFCELNGEAKLAVTVGSYKIPEPTIVNVIGPKIESISKTNGYSGDTITITGKNFLRYGSSISVSFGDNWADVISVSDTKVVFRVPIPLWGYSLLLNDTNFIINLFNGNKKTSLDRFFTVKKSWNSYAICPIDLVFDLGQGFTYNDKGYIYDYNQQGFYCYSPNENSWSLKKTSPGRIFGNGIYVVDNNRVVIIGGDKDLNKVWEYNFESDSWKSHCDMPFSYYNATFFKDNRKVYILTSSNSFWCYDLDSNTFEHLNDAPLDGQSWDNTDRCAFVLGANAYIFNDGKTYQFSFSTRTWITLKNNPMQHEYYGINLSGFVLNNKIYLLDNTYTLYQYNHLSDSWTKTAKLPWDRSLNSNYLTNFVIENKAYVFSITCNWQGCAYYYSAQPQ